MLTDATVEAMLDAKFPSGSGNCKLSAHSAYSATGANLVDSKTNCNFAAAASRAKALAASCAITITAAATVAWIGAWDSAGTTFLGMFPNGGSDKSFQVDVGNDRILCEGHGYSNGDTVVFHGATAPTGLTAGTTYYVVGVTSGDPDYFQVAATAGGSAINITGQPAAGCFVSKILVDTYTGAGTHTVSSLSISL